MVSLPCVPKRRGGLDATLNLLGLVIPFSGSSLGVDGLGRWLVRWSIDDRTPRSLAGRTVERVRGQVTVEIRPTEPVRSDLPTCSGGAGEFYVSLSTVPVESQQLDPLPNELEIFPAGAFPALASNITFAGDAGIEAPPPGPWPQPHRVYLTTECILTSRRDQNVTGRVVLDTAVRRSHAGFECIISAETVESPPTPLTVVQRPPVGSSVWYTVTIPANYEGRIRITAFTNDRARAVSSEFTVSAGGGLGCGGPVEAEYYDVVQVGCEAYDCGWTGLSDRADVIGWTGRGATRYLATGIIDYLPPELAGSVVFHAVNSLGQAAGRLDRDGKTAAVLYGDAGLDDGATEMKVVENAAFLAVNDATEAAGYSDLGDHREAMIYAGGKVYAVGPPKTDSIAVDINNSGDAVVVAADIGGKKVQSLVYRDGKLVAIEDLGGSGTVARAINGAGTVVGSAVTADGWEQAFACSDKVGMVAVKPAPGCVHGTATDVNDAGAVVGTSWGLKESDASVGFRFTTDRGTEDLNALVRPEDGIVVRSAVAINNLGQILVHGSQNDSPGYFVLSPASIPQPQLPIP